MSTITLNSRPSRWTRPATSSPSWLPEGRGLAVFLLILACSLVFGVVLGIAGSNPGPLLGMISLVALGTLMWKRPVVMPFIFVAGAALFESFNLGFSDSLTDRAPFFKAISNFGMPVPIPVTFVEVLFVVSISIIAIQNALHRRPLLRGGSMLLPFLAYIGAVLFGLIYGVSTGGDFNIALWEVRAQAYLFFAYLIAVNTISNRRQVVGIVWVLATAIIFKAFLGLWRYFVTLDGDLSTIARTTNTNSMMAHEESYFFAVFLMMTVLLFLFRSNRAQLIVMAAFSPAVVFVFLANDRRAGMLAIGLGLFIILFLTRAILPARRKLIKQILIVAILVIPPYILLMSNAPGFIGQPASAVMSQFSPDEKDAASNKFRESEDLNLKYNILDNPVLGNGYGKTIDFYVPVADISDLSVFWNVIPHNTVLWVWLRTGFFGFIAFWFLIGSAIVKTALLARSTKDPYIQTVAVLTVASIVGWVAIGAVDQGLVDVRSTILIGTLLGIVASISAKQQVHKPADELARPEVVPDEPGGPTGSRVRPKQTRVLGVLRKSHVT